MTSDSGRAPARSRRPARRVLALAALVLPALAGCGVQDLPRFGWPSGITPQAVRMENLWKGSASAALVVGAFVLALILWACVAFRKRDDDLPRQVRYNLPVETMYTVVPFIIIATLFYFTARDETYVDRLSAHPAVTVDVLAFRWNWEFSYEVPGPNGQMLTLPAVIGRPGAEPTLMLPTGRSIRFKESSADVIHSFWVPAFLFKRDVIPGRLNQFEVSSINRTGTFVGRCAELCGMDHDRMDFIVKVVPPDQYDAYVSSLEKSAPGGGLAPGAPQAPTGASAAAPLAVAARVPGRTLGGSS